MTTKRTSNTKGKCQSEMREAPPLRCASVGMTGVWGRGVGKTGKSKDRSRCPAGMTTNRQGQKQKTQGCALGLLVERIFLYQTRQALVGIMGWPTLQPKALPNSSKFWTVPLTRHSPVE